MKITQRPVWAAPLLRRSSVLPQAKPRRRANSLRPSNLKGPRYPKKKHLHTEYFQILCKRTELHPPGLLAGGASAPRFSPQVKTLAQGRLCRPRALKSRRSEPKTKGHPFGCPFVLSSHYNLDISNFQSAFCILPNGPSGPRRFCGVRAFCQRQNLGAGRIHFARAI